MDTSQNTLAFNDGWQYAPAPESADHITVDEQYDLFIGGRFVAPEEGRYFETINPATEEQLSSVALATQADVDRAVKAARKAYSGPWSKMKAPERAKYIYRIARGGIFRFKSLSKRDCERIGRGRNEQRIRRRGTE